MLLIYIWVWAYPLELEKPTSRHILRKGGGPWRLSTPPMSEFWFACSCAGNLSCCEFMKVITMSYAKTTFHSIPPYVLVLKFFLPFPPCSLSLAGGGVCMIQNSCLGMNNQSLLCTITVVYCCIDYCAVQKEADQG